MLKEDILQHPTALFIAHPLEPLCHTKASKVLEWHATMDTKFTSLQYASMWSFIPFQSNINVVVYKLVYHSKQNPNRFINMYNVRLIAKGFHQQLGVDFIGTFTLVVKHNTIHIILTLALTFNLLFC